MNENSSMEEKMAYDPTKESPRITIVNGYEVIERPDGVFLIHTRDHHVSDFTFPTLEAAENYAETLKPGPRSR